MTDMQTLKQNRGIQRERQKKKTITHYRIFPHTMRLMASRVDLLEAFNEKEITL